jgi:NAD(P)-dependent dehydrogenase (short-subunit alcohol dehydrogenase family)
VEIRLEGKNALVTGASSGIGQGIAVALAAAGASVGINYRSNKDGAEETARRVREAGQRALVMEADVGDPAQVTTMFRRFDADMGAIDILVANAGHGSSSRPLHETSWEEWDRVLRSNLHGAFLCGREAARRMLTAGTGGRIVNISSVHEEACNMPDDGPYCVAKGGVRNLTRSMALELGPHGS